MPVPLSWVPIVAKTTWARFEDDREKEAESSEEEAASLVQEAAGSLDDRGASCHHHAAGAWESEEGCRLFMLMLQVSSGTAVNLVPGESLFLYARARNSD